MVRSCNKGSSGVTKKVHNEVGNQKETLYRGTGDLLEVFKSLLKKARSNVI